MATFTIELSRKLAASCKLVEGCTISVSGKGDWITYKDGHDYGHYITYQSRGKENVVKVFTSRKDLCEYLIDKGATYQFYQA